ncbi:restriction endonuclease subunit S [Vibrio parahaemolyticus]|nr:MULTISPECIES: restriction endonuclease subunit S [Vibrio]ELI1594452.1 restriction endonuclease subunit S [Vibrio alginolyticus]GHZ77917.1 restriction modification system, specificity subunit [Vibrio cholerae]EJB8574798.1 restriction endonuclease subunit S [Vibrio parahaemolyticus]ELB2950117.1 restriction endonuclease subunit S [Vibrio parahaemolyticus]MCC9653241.1 restriction endonuclease subunit S [Vibrio sp. MA64]
MVSEVKRLQPRLRFVDFHNDWTQQRIGSILTDISRPVHLLDNELYQLVTVKRRNEGVVPRSVVKGKNILVKNYFAIKAGDFLISKRQVVHGANGIVPESLDNAVVSNEYLVVTDNQKITAKFWSTISNRPEIKKLYFISSYGVDIEKLVFDLADWKERYIPIPQLNEQRKITDFFQNLEQQIKLHQDKHSKLQQLKQAMLGKMFPKTGTNLPEVRFAGFSGNWVSKTLGIDVATVIGGGTPNTMDNRYWNGDIDWYSPTEIGFSPFAYSSVKKITRLGLKNSSAKILPKDKTILFTSRAGIGDMAILKNEATTNQGFQSLVLNEGYDTYFIYSMGHLIKDYALQNASGSTFLEISGKTLGKMKVKIPSLTEQTKIGQYFQNLDNLIALQQQKINKLKNIKQACLRKMFV